jgi:hypothetical protein
MLGSCFFNPEDVGNMTLQNGQLTFSGLQDAISHVNELITNFNYGN